MNQKKAKWLIYTVMVGLIPIVSRLFAWFLTSKGIVKIFSASDFVAFGLILHISNINEIENVQSLDPTWRTIQNGISIVFICFYSVLYAFNLISEGSPIVKSSVLTGCSALLSLVSFVLSYTVYDRLSKMSRVKGITK
jgi:hypothetical protein